MKAEKNYQFKFENNSFDLWRYWATLSVMLLHYTGYALQWSNTGIEELRFIRGVVSFFPGVVVLFAISGYLIAASIEHCPSRKLYLKKRFIRIYPELWIGTIVNIGLLLVLARDKMDYSMISWVITQIFGMANTPGCLRNFATGSVNGALWTIFVEIQLYIVIGFAYRVLTKFKESHWYILMGTLAVLNILSYLLSNGKDGILPKAIERCCVPYALWFFIGVYIYMHREDCVGRIRRISLPLLVIYIICYLFRESIPGYYCDIATGVLCPIIVIGFSYIIPPRRIRLDITYGLFLYHWLVLNVFTHFHLFSKMNWLMGIVLFSAIAFALAYLSNFIAGVIIKKEK